MGMVDAVQGNGERRGSRRALFLALAVAGLAVISLFGLWWGWLERTPVANIPQPQMPAENAHDDWNAATLLMNAGQDRQIADAVLASVEPAQPMRGKAVVPLNERAALVAAHQGALKRFREGLQHPYLEPPARSFTQTFPHFAQYRSLARLVRLEGQVRAHQGDWGGALNSDLDALQMGVQIPNGNPLIGALVGLAIQSVGRADAWTAVNHLSRDEARAALARLEKIRAQEVPFWRSVEEDKWLVQATLLDMMRKPNWRFTIAPMLVGGGPGAPAGADQWLLMAQMATSSKSSLFESYSNYMDRNIAAAKQPSTLPPAQIPLPSNTAARILAPVVQQARFGADRAKTMNALLHLKLALRVFRHDHGSYPRLLEELSPRYVKSLPGDPFGGDKPFRYLRTSRSFKLYSVGPDRKDDGGQPIPEREGERSRIPANNLEVGSSGDIVVSGN